MRVKPKRRNEIDVSPPSRGPQEALVSAGIRLEAKDHGRLVRAAASKSIPPAVLGRSIIREWLDREKVA